MYITRSFSIKLAFSIIAIFIGGTILLVKQNREKNVLENQAYDDEIQNKDSAKEKETSTNTSTNSATSNSSSTNIDDPNMFVMKNFKRSETKDGKVAWEIEADRGLMIPGDTKAKIENARIKFFRENGQTLNLTAPYADLVLSTSSVEKASLHGGVTFSYENGYTINTQNAEFLQSTNIITSDTETTIRNDDFEIIGKKLHFDGNTKILNLTDGVKTTIFGKDSGDGSQASVPASSATKKTNS